MRRTSKGSSGAYGSQREHLRSRKQQGAKHMVSKARNSTVWDMNKIKHCGTVAVKWKGRGGKAEKY